MWWSDINSRGRFAIQQLAEKDPRWREADFAAVNLDSLRRTQNIGRKTMNEVLDALRKKPHEDFKESMTEFDALSEIKKQLDRIERSLNRVLCNIQ